MSWTVTSAEVLLHAAFPWGAHVTVEGGSEFVSVCYAVVEEDFGVAEALLRFERDPGDTLELVRRSQFEDAVNTGSLDLDSGARVRQPEVTDMPLLASPFRDLIGYQPTSEHGWIARMRSPILVARLSTASFLRHRSDQELEEALREHARRRCSARTQLHDRRGARCV